MNIIFYTNNSENNKVTKSLTTLFTLTGTLREGTSITNPVFHIETTSDLSHCNYCYISNFGRYFFITDIENVRNNIWLIKCKCDVLMSFATQIKNNTGVIKRQQKKYNLYLDDGVFKAYQNPYVITKKFPNGFTTQSFILSIAGGN